MALQGERYTAMECNLEIAKHELLEKIHGERYDEVVHEAGKILH